MYRTNTPEAIGLCFLMTFALGCGSADTRTSDAISPSKDNNAQAAPLTRAQRGKRLVDDLVVKARAMRVSVAKVEGDRQAIGALKSEFKQFLTQRLGPAKKLLASMTPKEKAEFEAYAASRVRPALGELRVAFQRARAHARKPTVQPKPGESRPPAHHSEHQEQMRSHGGAKVRVLAKQPRHGKDGTAIPAFPHAKQHAAHGKGYQAHSKHHRFQDAAKWAKIFESKKRDKWQRGDAVVASLKLARDARIADVGAGTGYFAIRFAKHVRSGVVYAVDIEETMVDWVLKRAARKRLENVVGVVASADSAKLPGAVDLVFVSNTYHHINERSSYFSRLHRKLRKGGRVVIVDFKMGKLPVGPPDSHKISPKRVENEMSAAGYRLVRRDDKLLPYQHLFEFVAK